MFVAQVLYGLVPPKTVHEQLTVITIAGPHNGFFQHGIANALAAIIRMNNYAKLHSGTINFGNVNSA